jgi:hypothetical protein
MTDDPHYDVDIAGEVACVQSTVSPKQGETWVEAVSHHLDNTINVAFKGDVLDYPPAEEMTPYVPSQLTNHSRSLWPIVTRMFH